LWLGWNFIKWKTKSRRYLLISSTKMRKLTIRSKIGTTLMAALSMFKTKIKNASLIKTTNPTSISELKTAKFNRCLLISKVLTTRLSQSFILPTTVSSSFFRQLAIEYRRDSRTSIRLRTIIFRIRRRGCLTLQRWEGSMSGRLSAIISLMGPSIPEHFYSNRFRRHLNRQN